MKRKLQFVFIWLFLLTLHSCVEEEINNTCADPLGSDHKIIINDNFSCFEAGYFSCFQFQIDNSPPVIQAYYTVVPSDAPRIVDIGEVECLKEVTQKPESGWAYAVDAVEHHGYVVLLSDSSYGRFFIDSFEKSGTVVTAVNITRQYSY